MNQKIKSSLSNKNYWIFSLYFFLYFFIMGAYCPFFPVWLKMNGLDEANTGYVFSFISLFALFFQPLFGLISDKLGLKKHLLWVITLLLVLFGPFFIFVLGPLLKLNVTLGAIVGGLYLGMVFSGGAPAIEALVEKISRRSGFEFGRCRMFGCFGWAICASFVGIMISKDVNAVFWLCSGFALILLILVKIADPAKTTTTEVVEQMGLNKPKPFNLKLALDLLSMRKTWFFMLYIVGVACTYDVFDQQFANFFTSFFTNEQVGREAFGYVTTLGEFLNATVMFFAPLIVMKLGSKNTLLIAGAIMSIRITGSAFASTAVEVVILKTLHMFEAPLLLVGAFKYITKHFPIHLSATVYLIAFCFAKQLSIMFMSTFAGLMYVKIGFEGAYLILGLIAFSFTLISSFTLSGRGPWDLWKHNNSEESEN
ncbi:MAG: MFS transporter [Gilliamella sp.]|uniref:MFS transporter n=1 Tax=unclassified Gilliamella TaxID=2685620 RepID=UPI00080E3488|nr:MULTISPECIES: MFS transporter [Gilliamella]MCO6538735.1 MFS transporter [Gilliamella sp.]MCO6549401.1 MFS transporter [Gilliamella sp.]MCO6554991.1 MFS transporter [Gilliamella sp.]OCG34180.1 galactoside permease [Gilliamella apicola]OCG52396.1 galactoside permease [Gilliamella apicola]